MLKVTYTGEGLHTMVLNWKLIFFRIQMSYNEKYDHILKITLVAE